MEVQNYYPKNALLKTHIEYYYFLKTDNEDYSELYYSFPNTSHSFNIHKNACCEIMPDYTLVNEDQHNKYLSILQGKYETPLLVRLKGKLDKVTVIFKPLGFNHFIHKPFADLASQSSQIFDEWQGDPEYNYFLENFYATTEHDKRIEFLEDFLLSKYHSFSYYTVLQKVISQLANFDVKYSIEEIAKNTGMNIRTFNRLFYSHLGISPTGYRKICRFRHSLKNKLFSDNFKKLTDIGYESNFYDQSYFIKMYRKLTKDSPTSFFRSIDKLADDQLILKFISR